MCFQQNDGEMCWIYVDDFDGIVYKVYGGMLNVVFIINCNGCVVFCVDWNNFLVICKVIK